MFRFIFLFSLMPMYCAGAAHSHAAHRDAAHNDEPSLAQRLIKLMPYHDEMAAHSIVCRYAKKGRKDIFAVAVCHQEKNFTLSASRVGANYISNNPDKSVTDMWKGVKKHLKYSGLDKSTPALFVGLFFFKREFNASVFLGKGSLMKTMFYGQVLLPQQKNHVLQIENRLDSDLSYPICVGMPFEGYRVDVDLAVYDALK